MTCMCFHAIQRTDRKIDDRDDEQEKQFAEDCFNQLKKSVEDGSSSKGRMSKPALKPGGGGVLWKFLGGDVPLEP